MSTASFLSFLSFYSFSHFLSFISPLRHVDLALPRFDPDRGKRGGGQAGAESSRAGLGLRKRPADRQTDGQIGAPLVIILLI